MSYWFTGKLYENEKLSISPSHPALAYGASVFTTLRIYEKDLDHPLTAWEMHCDRISQSLEEFSWLQPNWQNIKTGCQILSAQYPVLRLTIFAAGNELITGRSLPSNLTQQQIEGVTVWVAQEPRYQRSLANHKTSNYLPCWLAMQTAKTQGARDAILINDTEEWLETSTGNLWGYQADRWWTPPHASGLLPGIARARLLETLGSNAITNKRWTLNVVKKFECLAYSNCVVGIMPIHTVLLGNIKLNYSSTHEGLSSLRHMFDRPSMREHNC
ncbi:MAG: 4-amino-4-deoxychorismate lyase [Leptolyngbya sp. SIO3F4]|nr:4-amino-4-deoxychorismate lyase [Leptolyngbya sp. SIO3F4]